MTTAQPEASPASRPPGHLARLKPGNLRAADVRVFSSASDAPRARRPTDVVLLVLAIVVIAALSFAAPGPGRLDQAVVSLVKALPGLVGWLWEISYDLLFVWALFVLGVSLFAHARKRLLFGELLAGGLAYLIAMAAGGAAGSAWSDGLRSLTSSDPPAVYPAMRLAIAAAIIVAASPHLSRPLRTLGRLVVTLGALASITLGIAEPIGVVAGLAVGVARGRHRAPAARFAGRRLSLDQVAQALADLGVEATDLRYAPLEPSGVSLVLATAPDGGSLLVKIYGRDAWDGQLLTSIWSSLWNRGETPEFGGRLHQVEHEAFVTLFAERQGVPAMPVVAAGMAAGRDAVLVVATGDAQPLARLDPARIDDAVLTRIWQLDARLFDLRIAHGALDGFRVAVYADGTPAVGDFSQATVSAADAALRADRAQLLVSTALLVDHARAVTIARDVLGADAIAEMLPYLQPAALDRATRHAVRAQDWDLDDLRQLASEAAGVELPKLEQIRRVTWASIVMLAVIGLVAYAVISAVANVGLAEPDRIVPGRGPGLAGARAGALADGGRGAGVRDDRRLHQARPVRAGGDAAVLDPVRRAGGAQLGRQDRPGDPLLRQGGDVVGRRHRGRGDRQRLRIHRPDPRDPRGPALGLGDPRPADQFELAARLHGEVAARWRRSWWCCWPSWCSPSLDSGPTCGTRRRTRRPTSATGSACCAPRPRC